jgi:hypothetical protein
LSRLRLCYEVFKTYYFFCLKVFKSRHFALIPNLQKFRQKGIHRKVLGTEVFSLLHFSNELFCYCSVFSILNLGTEFSASYIFQMNSFESSSGDAKLEFPTLNFKKP